MRRACIGVHVASGGDPDPATLASLRAHTVPRADLLVLGGGTRDAALARLDAMGSAPVLVLVEDGLLVAPGWLDELLAALDADPRNGVALASVADDLPVAVARAARLRRGWVIAEASSAACMAVRRERGGRTVLARRAIVHRSRVPLPEPIGQSPPLVSCVMPTCDRVEMALQAVRYFQRQDYPHRELVIVDDGPPELARRLPADDRIRYLRLEGRESVGAKRNRGCAAARGAIVAQWDDDDWHGPDRLTAQLEPLLAGEADVSALRGALAFDLQAWRFWAPGAELHRRLFAHDACGGTLVFPRRLWEQGVRYPLRWLAEDAAFLERAVRRGARLAKVPADGRFLYVRHGANSWARAGAGEPGWSAAPEPALAPADRAFYRARARSATAPPRRRRPGARPLVSCIMPTAGRRSFAEQALAYFLRQDYARRELIVVDDPEAEVADLLPADPRVRYHAVDGRLSLGAKRNLACELARGAIVVHWDDDDWMAPYRLRYQVEELERHGADLCGARRMLFFDPARERAWHFEYEAADRRRLLGATLCYRRSLWERQPFKPLAVGEDSRFVRGPAARNAVALAEHRFTVGIVHGANTSPKRTTDTRWIARPVTDVERLLGRDLGFYANGSYVPNDQTLPSVSRALNSREP